MGDRCYLEMTLRKQDLPIWQKVFSVGRSPANFESWYDSELAETDDLLKIEVEEANYAWYEELEQAAKLGALFIGSHGAGGNYGPGRFLGFEKARHGLDTDENGTPVVTWDERLNRPDPESVQATQKFFALEKRLLKQLPMDALLERENEINKGG